MLDNFIVHSRTAECMMHEFILCTSLCCNSFAETNLNNSVWKRGISRWDNTAICYRWLQFAVYLLNRMFHILSSVLCSNLEGKWNVAPAWSRYMRRIQRSNRREGNFEWVRRIVRRTDRHIYSILNVCYVLSLLITINLVIWDAYLGPEHFVFAESTAHTNDCLHLTSKHFTISHFILPVYTVYENHSASVHFQTLGC
jgi:hypothetical protein